MSAARLRRIAPEALPTVARDPLDAGTLREAAAIVDDVRTRGVDALREYAEKFGDLERGAPMFFGPDALGRVLDGLDDATRAVLERTADRVRAFSEAQLAAISATRVEVPGGEAGHELQPMEVAGCYAPGGRFTLPSSVLMTAIPARVAGVRTVWVASPDPAPATLAAAAIAGADGLLCVGGPQAIAALAYGIGPIDPACDVVVGPGNRWVTAAKHHVGTRVRIDMLAGPSELLVLADESADAVLVAADLLAQAEHDTDALPVLVTTCAALADRVDREIERQLSGLPTAAVARVALERGFTVIAPSLDAAIDVADRVAPEHLEVICRDAEAVARRLRHYGALFVGPATAQVLGDYGIGPNHVLPTGGTARHRAGLSVLDFLRPLTWVRIDDPVAASQALRDAASLARLEGLEGHARSAERRLDLGVRGTM
jgi:phosphoribosyl-ATP pyrophosphohydrolase/phosphoribosyl-AMP cyclohydrolase/histidinol dehydrogenase